MQKYFFPLPPSVNSYWGFHGHRRFLTDKAKTFKNEVKKFVILNGNYSFGKSRLELAVTFNFKDKRKQDIDNRLKSLLDAMTQAGIYEDDSQIDILHVYRGTLDKQGSCIVLIKRLDSL